MFTRQQQLDALGIGVDAYEGLVVIEIAGPPIVSLTTHETRRFYQFLERAYRDAFRDRDALIDRRNRARAAAGR